MIKVIRRKLSGLLRVFLELSTQVARQTSEVGLEENEVRQNRAAKISAIMATMVSVVAMIFSAFSFYETSLRKAKLQTYPPSLVHMLRDDFRDMFVIPVTISNDGARRGTILSFRLTVTNPETKQTSEFQSIYAGKVKDKSLFSPVSIEGRSTYTNIIHFKSLEKGTLVQKAGGDTVPLHFSLSLDTDGKNKIWGPEKTEILKFQMTAPYALGFNEMKKGKPTIFYNKSWKFSQ